jgi:transposase
MYYLAFDVSKDKIDGVITNLRTKRRYVRIMNTDDDIDAWITQEHLPKKFVAGCESTGAYHLTLVRTFRKHGYHIKVINPILTKQFPRSTIRKKKTDVSDSFVIATLLAQGEGQEATDENTPRIEQRMRTKLRQTALKVRLRRKSLALYEQHQTISQLEMRLLELEDAIDPAAENHLAGLKDRYASDPAVHLLQSIPGIGFHLALIIWTEIGDVSRFSSPKQLVAFAGLDPRIRQSGSVLKSQGRLTKRGSPHLRRALFLAAGIARMFDPDMKQY